MTLILLTGIVTGLGLPAFAQPAKEMAKPLSREELFAKHESALQYPLIKAGLFSGILPVENIMDEPAPDTKIKLLFDFTQATAPSALSSQVNEGLEEVARILNLHIAAGIKQENLKVIIVFHSGAILSILNNEYYQNYYKSDNPNITLLKQIEDAGASLLVCGQTITIRGFTQQQLLPQIKIAYSAKTTSSKYQSAGFILFPIMQK